MPALSSSAFAVPPLSELVPLAVVTGSQPIPRVTGRHSHPQGQLLGATRGLLSVGTEGGLWVVPATHAVWVPPHQPHSLRSHGAFEGWSVYVAEKACEPLPALPLTVRMSELMRAAVMRAAQWPAGQPWSPARQNLAAVMLDEIALLEPESFSLPLPREPRLLRLAEALAADPASEAGLAEWAAFAGLSARTVSRRFVSETGFSFTEWRQRLRLMRSLEMLAEGLPVTTIAIDLGYSSVSAFIALFRRCFGQTPAAYHRQLTAG